MEDLQLLDAIERYLTGQMPADERANFEALRKSNPEIDQLVVEHTIFMQQMGQYSDRKNLKSTLQDVHTHLVSSGAIKEKASTATVIQIWKKYKKVVAVAASIAGITTLFIASIATYYSRQQNNKDIEELKRDYKNEIVKAKNEITRDLNTTVKSIITTNKAPENVQPKSGGTGFLIDGKGFIVTNAHVVDHSSTVVVQNNKGEQFRAHIIYVNPVSDLAFLKIQDDDFKEITTLPYGIKRTGADLGEPLFTLGYPREEIVYNEGYMSAKTGYNGDTLTCQIGVPANPGNSGGPVFNKNGEIVGVLSARQTQAEGVVFAIKARGLYKMVDNLKQSDTSLQKMKMPSSTSLKGMNRVDQIKELQNYVFIVKAYNQK